MKSGEVKQFTLRRGKATPATVSVHYESSPSYGDDNQPVRGASVGRYTVSTFDVGGRSRTFEHGPHAETEAARKRGANPYAKALVAGHVRDHLMGLA